MIFFTDSTNAVIPAYKTMPATIMELRYSIRPWPRGCFLSGERPASLVPTMVMIEERASDRLLTASRMTAMEWDSRPTTALKADRNTLARIPITLVRMMILSRCAAALRISFSSLIYISSL